MPDMPQGPQTMTPEQQQSLMQMLQMARGNTMGNQPQGMPMLPGGGPTQPQLGPGNVMLPSGTAIPGVGNIPISATPPRQTGGVSARGIGMVPGLVMAIKQKATQDKMNKARAVASQQIAMLQDPAKQKSMEEAAKTDPKIAKILDKQKQDFVKMYDKAITDPDSPEARGVQMAYRDSMRQDEMKMKFEQLRAQVQESQQKALAERARAYQEQAHGGLYEKQTELEGQVTEKDKFQRETELMKYRQQQEQKGYTMEVRGLSPAVKGPDGKNWSWQDLQDPVRSQAMPAEAKTLLAAERQSKQLEVDEQFARQSRAFAQQITMWGKQMEKMEAAPLVKGYGEDIRNAMNDNMRLARMNRNAELAKRGDSQAMIALLSDHVNMTLRQPGTGAMRVTLAQWKEAESSSTLLARLGARFSPEGFLIGVALAPEQIDQMVQLGVTQREIDWMKAQKSADAIRGLGTKDIRMPDPNMPGLPPIDIQKLLNPGSGGGGGSTDTTGMSDQEKEILKKLQGK